MQRRRLAWAGALVALTGAAWVFRVWLFHDNLHVVAPGQIYRSAQLDTERLDAVSAELGLRSVLNLRGEHPGSQWFRRQRALLEARGIDSFDIRLSAQRLPSRQDLIRLVDALERAERPLLIHCLRGTDRSGLAAALVVLLEGGDLSRAREQYTLAHGYLHGVSLSDLPDLLDDYQQWLTENGLGHAPEELLRFARRGYTPYFYRAVIEPVRLPLTKAGVTLGASGQVLAFDVTNASPQPWRLTPAGDRGVHLGLRIESADPARPFELELRGKTPRRTLAPGESIRLGARLPRLPGAGRYRLSVDLVDEEVTWFADMGSPSLEFAFAVAP